MSATSVYRVTGPVSIQKLKKLSEGINPAEWGLFRKDGHVLFGETSPEIIVELPLLDIEELAQEKHSYYGQEELFFLYHTDRDNVFWMLATKEDIDQAQRMMALCAPN